MPKKSWELMTQGASFVMERVSDEHPDYILRCGHDYSRHLLDTLNLMAKARIAGNSVGL